MRNSGSHHAMEIDEAALLNCMERKRSTVFGQAYGANQLCLIRALCLRTLILSLATILAACTPAIELPADAGVSPQLRELFRAGRFDEVMPQLLAEQRAQQLHLQEEDRRRRAEQTEYIYRPPPALFHQSVVIDAFDPLGFEFVAEAMAASDTEAATDRRAGRQRETLRAKRDAESAAIDRRMRERREIMRATGDPQRELAAIRRIVAEREAELGPNHADVVAAIGHLGMALAESGDVAAGRETLQRALATAQRALGPMHPGVAIALDHLAKFHLQQGEPGAAESLYERALEIRSKAPAPTPRVFPATLNNLGVAAARRGQHSRASAFYDQAIARYEEAIGQVEKRVEDFAWSMILKQDVVVVHANAGLLAWQHGETEQAIAAFQRARRIHNVMRWLGFDRMSEAQQLAMIGAMSEEIETFTALELGYAPGRADAATLSLGGILEHKGRALESLARTMAAAAQPPTTRPTMAPPLPGGGQISIPSIPFLFGPNVDPEARDRTRTELASVRSQLANLSLFSGGGAEAEARRVEIERLARRERELAGALGDRVQMEQDASRIGAMSRELIESMQRESDAKSAARARPSEERMAAMTLEMMPGYAESKRGPTIVPAVQRAMPADAVLVEIATYRPLDPKVGEESKRWGARRYAAYVLASTGEPRSVDLGEVSTIDQLAADLRRALATPRGNAAQLAARRLDGQVMAPIRRLIGDVRHVLLAPEGALHLVPFGALQDEQGRYLTERYTFTYLTTGRDLLRMGARARPRRPPVIVADPDFGRRPAAGGASASAGETSARSVDFTHVEFEALPGTAREAKAIQDLYPDALLLTGAQATEAAIKRVQGPRILHVASHGFFLPDQSSEQRDSRMGRDRPRENPLLRSGLVLAGANRGASGGEDGVLTALELAGLDLNGTQLVTLSACETGLGDVERGEGVYGLRRALWIAGAQSQAISLWKVDDETTETLMIDFYRRLQGDIGPSEALRQAQLRLLSNPQLAHPFFWAGFIVSGDWRALGP